MHRLSGPPHTLLLSRTSVHLRHQMGMRMRILQLRKGMLQRKLGIYTALTAPASRTAVVAWICRAPDEHSPHTACLKPRLGFPALHLLSCTMGVTMPKSPVILTIKRNSSVTGQGKSIQWFVCLFHMALPTGQGSQSDLAIHTTSDLCHFLGPLPTPPGPQPHCAPSRTSPLPPQGSPASHLDASI